MSGVPDRHHGRASEPADGSHLTADDGSPNAIGRSVQLDRCKAGTVLVGRSCRCGSPCRCSAPARTLQLPTEIGSASTYACDLDPLTALNMQTVTGRPAASSPHPGCPGQG
jgi:hypothetical protein